MPGAMPIFRNFLATLVEQPQHDTSTLLRAALTRCLAILKQAQRREVAAAAQCEKNVLLASTMLLSTAASLFKVGDPLLDRFVDELCECLETPLPTKLAAGCCRSLLLQSRKGKVERHLEQQLLPKLIAFITREPDEEEAAEIAASQNICTATLVAYVQSLDKPRRSEGMSLVIPVLLAAAEQEGTLTQTDIAVRLLEIAQIDQSSFRAIVGAMDADTKSFMEEVLKAGGLGRQQEGPKKEEPAIALKMFGS